jgi:membrane protein YdbS with pleckstrin-like domain
MQSELLLSSGQFMKRGDDEVLWELAPGDIDVMEGACAFYAQTANLYFCVACLCFPICYYRVKTQEITMTSKKMHLKYDNGCDKQDNYIPLERIQDVDISQNCCFRLCGAKNITIATAGGTPIRIIGLKNTEAFREEVLRRRDVLVHSGGGGGGGSSLDDGTCDNIVGNNKNNSYNVGSGLSRRDADELREMKECLLRIEKQVEMGLIAAAESRK